jgi:hypothetical protein
MPQKADEITAAPKRSASCQKRHKLDADNRTACAFRAHRPTDSPTDFCCAAIKLAICIATNGRSWRIATGVRLWRRSHHPSGERAACEVAAGVTAQSTHCVIVCWEDRFQGVAAACALPSVTPRRFIASYMRARCSVTNECRLALRCAQRASVNPGLSVMNSLIFARASDSSPA